MLLGALGMGLHIAASQGALLGMLAAHMPRGEVPGLGRASGTAWALTDLLLGEHAVAGAAGRGMAGAQLAGWWGYTWRRSAAGLLHCCRSRVALALPLHPAGCSLAGANLLAGRLNDWSAARGWGSTGCFMGAVAAAAAAMAALLAFGAWGELGREAGAAAPAPQ